LLDIVVISDQYTAYLPAYLPSLEINKKQYPPPI
jgi:hypothetical protein